MNFVGAGVLLIGLMAGKLAGEVKKNSLGMALMKVGKGEFLMGSAASEKGRSRDEQQVRVTFTSDFFMGATEVTQKQWFDLMGTTFGDLIDQQREPDGRGAKLKNVASVLGDDEPMSFVSWEDAQLFCAKLTEKERAAGLIPEGSRYDLPTEAEWEYACRAGTATVFAFGDTLESRQANFYGKMPYGVEKEGEYRGKSTPVGSFPANDWGLHDLHGNLYEWCCDWYGGELPGGVDPMQKVKGDGRIIRGGAWDRKGASCRAAYRYSRDPVRRAHNIGFRVVLVSSR